MRDPNRIDEVLDLLKIYWKKHPDLRLAQIVGNCSPHRVSYNLEDDILIEYLKENIKQDK